MSEFKPKNNIIYISFSLDTVVGAYRNETKGQYCCWYSSYSGAMDCVYHINRNEMIHSPPALAYKDCSKSLGNHYDILFPNYRKYWLCFDLANGHGRQHYFWIYRTREEAREKVKEHKNNPRYVLLSSPEKWYINF